MHHFIHFQRSDAEMLSPEICHQTRCPPTIGSKTKSIVPFTRTVISLIDQVYSFTELSNQFNQIDNLLTYNSQSMAFDKEKKHFCGLDLEIDEK